MFPSINLEDWPNHDEVSSPFDSLFCYDFQAKVFSFDLFWIHLAHLVVLAQYKIHSFWRNSVISWNFCFPKKRIQWLNLKWHKDWLDSNPQNTKANHSYIYYSQPLYPLRHAAIRMKDYLCYLELVIVLWIHNIDTICSLD